MLDRRKVDYDFEAKVRWLSSRKRLPDHTEARIGKMLEVGYDGFKLDAGLKTGFEAWESLDNAVTIWGLKETVEGIKAFFDYNVKWLLSPNVGLAKEEREERINSIVSQTKREIAFVSSLGDASIDYRVRKLYRHLAKRTNRSRTQ